MSRFYVTTPIYYVNDVPHLGTAYSTIVVDALRRYHLLRGDTTRMLTGTDEHGLKLEREAQVRGMTPIAFVDQMSAHFRQAWPKLEIEPSDFIRTTEPRHEQGAQALWEQIVRHNPDDIYLGSYEDWYCVGCEEFKTEKDLLQPGNLCAIHRTPVERLKEDTYFFRLSRYTEPLLRLYEEHPEFIQPESRRNEVVSFVSTGLRDLSISRTKLTWGIPVPGDPKHVMYVWFDALSNYWTALQGSDDAKAFWSGESGNRIVHVVGKDILRFHTVYWPAFLMSAGLPLPTTVYAHGFLTFNGLKMSKSLRNAVEPLGIARAFGHVVGSEAGGADVLRYQLLRAIAFGQDGDFDLAAMIERYNADLGKNLGNLLARTLGLCVKMTDSKVPPRGEATPLEIELLAVIEGHWRDAVHSWDRIEPHRALERVWAIASAANQYVDRAAPWAEDKKGNRGRVDTILNTLLSVLGALSVAMWPVLPAKSDEMRRQLGLAPVQPGVGTDWLAAGVPARAGGEALAPGKPLFPTVDEAGAKALLDVLTPKGAEGAAATSVGAAGAGPAGAGPAGAGVARAGMAADGAGTGSSTSTTAATATIGYDQFGVVDLRVGVVRTAERVPKKDKLLKLAVDVGEAAPRTIVAGLALSFQPEALVGRRVIVVANLAPREFGKGLVSHGMLLATGPSENLVLATVEGDAAPGARLK